MKRTLLLLLCAVLLISFWGCTTVVKRVDEKTVTDLSGRWNDTDSQLVAEQMVKESLERPWLTEYMKAKGKNPTVIVGSILNKTDEHIAIDVFQKNIERELTNSNKVTFVASKTEREEVRDERTDQQEYASDATKKEFKKEFGADYMLKGVISTVTDEKEGTKAVFYQVDMEMVNMETNAKEWYGQKKIKKIIAKSQLGF